MNYSHQYALLLLVFTVCHEALAQAPRDYYDGIEGKKDRELKTELHYIIKDHTELSYKQLWTAFKDTDARPDGSVWDMYSDCQFKFVDDQCGNYQNVGDCYNREHSFPKSWFDDKYPMYTDLFHLYPTDGKVNGQRGNYPFGECEEGKYLSKQARGKLGKSTFPGYSGQVFEPDDAYKGDFARSYFYMATRYEDRFSTFDSPMLAHNSYPCYTDWAVELLLEWHRADSVSQKEIDRNNAVYKKQHNRNPFIDYPQLVEYIWGDKKDEAFSFPTSIDAATRSSIEIACAGGSLTVRSEEPFVLHIYNLDGTLLRSECAQGDFSISIEWKGVAIVKVTTSRTSVVKKVRAD